MSGTGAPVGPKRQLPRRDLFLLPLLALATIVVMLFGAEASARWYMPLQETDACLHADPVLKSLPHPSCTSLTKAAEGEWVTNHYNSCGYRSETECGAIKPRGLRLAVLGSSASWGYEIPTDQTWWHRVATHLASVCNRPIDVQNLGGIFDFNQVGARVPEALALKPTAVVMIMSPFDLDRLPDSDFDPDFRMHRSGSGQGINAKPDLETLQKIKVVLTNLRATTAAQSLMYRNADTYVPLYLNYRDKADFLRPPFTKPWQRRLQITDQALGWMAGQIHKQGLPFILVLTPQQAQADIIASHKVYPGIDPFALNHAIAAIAARHGIVFRDLTPRFNRIEDAPALYLNTDGHLNGKGNGLIADAALDGLLAIPAIASCKSS